LLLKKRWKIPKVLATAALGAFFLADMGL